MATKMPQKRRLVLCFDGTGNEFKGNGEDTNVVKIYQMFDRTVPNQFHYYQPGIGTYNENRKSGSNGPLSNLSSTISSKIDQGVASSFEDHIAAGYRFLMRYYQDGDDIYIFGFSRGAYTARFLAEMIKRIGLLSMGNEEMVYFAWKTFAEYQRCDYDDEAAIEKAKENKTKTPLQQHTAFMENFKNTFCRQNVDIHFLGLFDCVNSVEQFNLPFQFVFKQKPFKYIPKDSANHIRHAVSLQERRCRFRPALFIMTDGEPKVTHAEERKVKPDIKEEWFAGNHGDVGGSWKPEPVIEPKQGEQIPENAEMKHLYSDTALNWMLQEVLNLPKGEGPEHSTLAFKAGEVEKYVQIEEAWSRTLADTAALSETGKTEFLKKAPKTHDMLKRNRGTSFIWTCFWWILESIPFFTRLELETNKEGREAWVPRHFPPPFGDKRDLDSGVKIHPSAHAANHAGLIDDSELSEKLYEIERKNQSVSDPSSSLNGHWQPNGHSDHAVNGNGVNGIANGSAKNKKEQT